MPIPVILKGLIIGLTIAAPVGPIGVLCIQRTLNGGYRSGLFTGLGAATADAAYGLIAAFGLTAVSDFMIRQKLWFGLIGGAFLCFLGVRALLRKSGLSAATAKKTSLLRDYGSTFFLTLTNPMTILFFIGIFSGFDVISQLDQPTAAAVLVLGVFFGSGLWWLSLSTFTGIFRRRFSISLTSIINKVAGTVIISFGLITILKNILFRN